MSKILSKTLSHAMMMQEKRLAVISNNLANANTSGYKSVQVSLEVPKSMTSERNPYLLLYPPCHHMQISRTSAYWKQNPGWTRQSRATDFS